MSYLSHSDFAEKIKGLQKGTVKGILKEAAYTDNYPGSWGYRENKEMEEGNAFTAALAKAGKGEKVKVGGKEITDTSNYDDSSVKEMEEGLNPAPMQATGATVDTTDESKRMGYEALTPDEQKQLKEYIKSYKTIEEEIKKLASKAGKRVKMEGGDRTGLVMHTGMKQ